MELKGGAYSKLNGLHVVLWLTVHTTHVNMLFRPFLSGARYMYVTILISSKLSFVVDMVKEKLLLMQQVAYQLVMLQHSECFMK